MRVLVAAFALMAATTIGGATPAHSQNPISSGPEYDAFKSCVYEEYLTGNYNSLNLEQSFSRIMKSCPRQMARYNDKCESEIASDPKKTDKCLMISYILVGLVMKK